MVTFRQLISRMLCDYFNIDKEVRIKIVRREPHADIVEYAAIVPLSYLDSKNNLCIEESEIKFYSVLD